ncbi:MAG: DNA (cytosine-5-)-methyltransferase, partial [Oscillospiraceae bacterium]
MATFLDLFAGIGGFRHGLERSGHKGVGHVEIDKYANMSYCAMYDLVPCKYRDYSGQNSCMVCKSEVNNNCDGTNCKGEWYGKDIKQLTAGEIPNAEIWTFGFPCTDISISNNKQLGLDGGRSGLFFEVARLLQGKSAEDRPKWIIVENVKNLLSIKRGFDYTVVLFELSELGYDLEWGVVNSKNFHVPQNRERVYIVGHLRGRCAGKIFPIGGANPAPIKQIVDGSQGNRVYDPSGVAVTMVAQAGGFGGRTG